MAVALAQQPLSVKGFGHVKLATLDHIKEARQKLLTEFRTIGRTAPIGKQEFVAGRKSQNRLSMNQAS